MPMNTLGRALFPLLVLAFPLGCGSGAQSDAASEWSIDQRSYNLGGIGAFAEMVGAGVKKLALSAPLDPEEMDVIVGEAERIAANHGVEVYRESDFLVTDLFSASLTEGKDVLLICHESTRREYLELKARKQRLVDAGSYDADARVGVATRMGELLSYSEEKIASLLAAGDGG
jgi:hypothetical protein